MKKRMNTALIAILIVIFATVSCGKTAKETAYLAGDPDEVAAVILHTNDVDTVPHGLGLPEEAVTRKNVERYVDPDMKAFIDEIAASYDSLMSRKIGDHFPRQ